MATEESVYSQSHRLLLPGVCGPPFDRTSPSTRYIFDPVGGGGRYRYQEEPSGFIPPDSHYQHASSREEIAVDPYMQDQRSAAAATSAPRRASTAASVHTPSITAISSAELPIRISFSSVSHLYPAEPIHLCRIAFATAEQEQLQQPQQHQQQYQLHHQQQEHHYQHQHQHEHEHEHLHHHTQYQHHPQQAYTHAPLEQLQLQQQRIREQIQLESREELDRSQDNYARPVLKEEREGSDEWKDVMMGPSEAEEEEGNGKGGKKARKRRRLKGQLPRDFALRKYCCTICEQKFARPSALATHNLTHTKEKPFKCATCSRGFAVMSNLRRHMMTRKHGSLSHPNSPEQHHHHHSALETAAAQNLLQAQFA